MRAGCLFDDLYTERKLCYLRWLFILYYLIITNTLFPQTSQLKFEHLTTTEGLSYNKVQCILQDKQGYIWFGTISGLNRYDGYAFKVFKNIPGDSSTITNDDIICLFQDSHDIIWVGTSTSSFSGYDPRTETFKTYTLPPSKAALNDFTGIHDFKEDDNGLLWLATGYGLFSFDKNRNAFTYYRTDDLSRENIHGILKDSDKNILWLATETGIRKFNKRTESAKTFSIPYPAFSDVSREITHNLIRDKQGNLWMTTSDSGVYCFNPHTEKFVTYTVNIDNDTSSLQTTATTYIMEDDDGKIWIGGEGLALFDPAKKFMSFYKINLEDPQGVPGKIRAIIKDRSGIYWLGTERGIAKYDPKLYSSFINIKSNSPYTLQTANTIVEDRDHKFWVGNFIGLGSMDTNTGIYTNENAVLGVKEYTPLFSSVLDKDGSMWFGSYSNIFHVYKKRGENVFEADKIPLPVQGSYSVTTLAMDNNGILWAGTKRGGLFSYTPSLKKFRKYTGSNDDPNLFFSNTISAILPISQNSILIGTEGKGIILMDTKNEKFENIRFQNNVNNTTSYLIIHSIYEDSKKNIWIGTDNDGLWQTNASLSTFANYSVKDGMLSTNITQIVEDDKGQIWLNTTLGLEVVVDPVKKRFVHYSEQDGLSINQPDYLIKKSSGDLIRIDYNGLHIFHSSSVNINKEEPPVYINRLRILDKDVVIYGDTVIHLPYNENYISFEYVTLNYTQSFKNQYAYRLTGLDKNWINAGDRRFASYANISTGTHTFQVKACNNNSIWNETPATVTLIISPPWWKTWWFYTIAALVTAGAFYTLFQYRLKQKLKAFELRNTISRDLHDEVGSTLSSIGFLSSMALNDVETSNVRAQKSLTSISESSHRMLDAMNDIIWSIQPQNDTLNNIIARMISFASEILEARKISLYYNIENDIKHLHLGLAVRYDFYIIFKEAINNLAKYSEATEAHITLEYSSPYLVLIIRDNGKGFDVQTVKNGNGLRNMQNRAKKMDAKYELHTAPGNGTKIILHVRPEK